MIVAVVGPTATGKSDLAVALARRLGGEVVNADAMQLYRGMDVGTAKLTPEERQGVPHHQLDVLDVAQDATVAAYQVHARADVADIVERGARPVVVGGSGLYVRALLDRLEIPPTDPEVRARLEARATLDGAVLAAWEEEVTLAPGERRLVFEVEAGALDAATTLVVATFAGTRTFRLLAEPKDARLAAATISARLAGDRLLLRTDAPVVDLFLFDAGGGLSLLDNWLTLPEASEVALPASGTLRGTLTARSLAGRHAVQWG